MPPTPRPEDDNRPLPVAGTTPPSRRDLLRWGGVVAAGVLGGLGSDGTAAHAALASPAAVEAAASTFSP
ncbi:twin-arginine translocation signal domain-containing protein, partial [Streptomyces sp. MBT65]|uniref:twin-arginine translocation signal domain-containing protein n=1 Tax=Streptomyces sp. MBT65 TaxID=1488395 RepID=UPI00190CB1AE